MPSWTANRRRYLRWSNDADSGYFVARATARPAPLVAIDAAPAACIEVNTSWRSHIVGALEVLLQDDAWLDSDRDFAKSQIYRLIEMLSEICRDMTDICCPETNEKLQGVLDVLEAIANKLVENNVINKQQLIINNKISNASTINYFQALADADDGTPESFAPGAPDTSFDADSGDATPEAIQARKDALCAAVSSYVKSVTESIIADYQGQADLTAALTAAIAAVAGAFGGGLPAIPVVVIGAGIGAESALKIVAMGNQAALEDAMCCALANLRGKTINLANFKAAFTNSCSLTGDAATILSEWAVYAIPDNYRSFVRHLAKANEAGVGDDCLCDDCANAIFDPGPHEPGYTIINMIDQGGMTYDPETFTHTITCRRYVMQNNANGSIRYVVTWGIRTTACCQILSNPNVNPTGTDSGMELCDGTMIGGPGGPPFVRGFKWAAGRQLTDEAGLANPVIFQVLLGGA